MLSSTPSRLAAFAAALAVLGGAAADAIGLLNPVIASLATACSSISVVANALRLRRFGR